MKDFFIINILSKGLKKHPYLVVLGCTFDLNVGIALCLAFGLDII
jgi:hypothetical protein